MSKNSHDTNFGPDSAMWLVCRGSSVEGRVSQKGGGLRLPFQALSNLPHILFLESFRERSCHIKKELIMAIKIREASDADITRAAEAEAAAYGNGSSILFPGPFPPGARIEGRTKQIIEMRNNDPSVRLLIAVDEETGEQIAFSKWHIYETPKAIASSPGCPLPAGPGVNEEACKAFFGGLVLRKQEIMGLKPHLCMCGL